MASTDFTDGTGLMTTKWHTVQVTEHLEYDYGLSDRIQIGARLSLGENTEVDDDDIVVFDGAQQIVPIGEREMGLAALVRRRRRRSVS